MWNPQGHFCRTLRFSAVGFWPKLTASRKSLPDLRTDQASVNSADRLLSQPTALISPAGRCTQQTSLRDSPFTRNFLDDTDTTKMTGSISHHLYKSLRHPDELTNQVYRNNLMGDSTGVPKSWLQGRKKNPYPTREKRLCWPSSPR
ncbi:hypothetical protein AGOR_G00039200 [Albula goreensis]|uniref:Uncharacterized protein n=1 Tax=Albula goreensis TaxID=1534307 RepID=A0A8T3DY32_9TELE|nr:hypothetical protein AGOR_G00039200 [Albula goreensis]